MATQKAAEIGSSGPLSKVMMNSTETYSKFTNAEQTANGLITTIMALLLVLCTISVSCNKLWAAGEPGSQWYLGAGWARGPTLLILAIFLVAITDNVTAQT